MNQKQIRDICYKCGHRSLVHVNPGDSLPTDFCDLAEIDCGKVSVCDPDIREPKDKETRRKKAVIR